MKNVYTKFCSSIYRGGGKSGFQFSKFISVLLICIFSRADINAQPLVITQSTNSQALAQLLAGPGVTISNYTLTCAANGSGTFTNNSSNLGINGGVVLASGRVSNIPNNASVFASTQFTATGDAQLSTLTGGTIYDPCILEFDIVPQGPLLKFDYVFASEEYPEWVCSQYNDVFGFFISGPNPGGGNYTNKNMAIIPSTNLPVAINTINPGTSGANANGGTCNGSNQSLAYTSYYVNNQVPLNPNIVYDGMTTVLQATASVTPCQTYHLKIAIADVADRIYDSGVFLKAYSFTTSPVTVSAQAQLDYAGFSSAYEGCVGGTFTLTLSQVQAVDVTVNLSITGTATNGSDYTTIPATVTIPAGQISVTIPLTPLVDGISESAETVTIATLNPCTGAVSSSASITIQDDIPANINVGDSTLCLGQSTQLTASGGMSYSWSPATGLSNPNISNPIATPTVTTTYTVSMNWGACTKTANATVYVSNPSLSTTATPAATVCNGGTVLISATSNGVAPYNYLWSNGATTPNITVATGGTYTVTTTDAYGCTAGSSQPVTISNIGMTGTSSNVSCLGGTNGSIDITVTGTNAPFTYNWNDGFTSQDRTNLVTGTYSVTVTNTVGCSISASYTISQPATNLTTSATNTPVSCNGGSNGTISLTVNGGVTPYSYLWSNGATTEDLATLTAGSYSVTVTDFNGCTASRAINITQPSATTTTETHVNENCFGQSIGSIDLTVTGGLAPYTYVWSTGATTQDLNSLSAGTYSVSVADSNSCVVTRSIIITEPSAVTPVPNTTNPSCFGSSSGSINLSVTGGTPSYTFNWSNAATTQNISGLSTGTFTVTVTDVNLCTGTVSATLTQPSVLSTSSTQTNVTCNGGNNGSITLTVTGGTTPYLYNWGGGITTQNRTSLTAGTYTVTVTDNNGCTAARSTTITQPSPLSVSNTNTNVSCNGGVNGSINISVTGGTSPYTFNWGGGVTTEDRTNLSAGTYTVTVTDSRGCIVSSSINITQPAVLAFSETHTNVSCNGGNNGSINITITGGTVPYSYNWGGGIITQNRTGLVAGTYNLTTTDSRGCTVAGSTTITQPSAIDISHVVTDATCSPGNNGEIDVTVTGGNSPYTYDWGGGITTADRTTLFAGTYTVTVADNSGCTASKAISVSQIGIGMTLSASSSDVSCNSGNDGAIDVTITGGNPPITYNWGGGITTEDRAGLAAGNYSVTVTDGLGCSAIANSNISEPSPIVISISKTNVACYGESTGSILSSVSGGMGFYTYEWGGGITTQNRIGIPAGVYNLTITDGNLCTATEAAIVVDEPSTAVNLSATSNNVSCFGQDNGSVTLNVSGGTPGYDFIWSNGSISQNLTNVVSGTYSVTATDANSCSSSLTMVVTQPSPALAVSLAATNLICNSSNTGTITTTVSGGTPSYNFNWGGGVTTQNRSSLSAGNYSVTVDDNNGCTITASVSLTEPSAISITESSTNVSCNGLSDGTITLNITGGTGTYAFIWNDAVTTQNRTGLTAGTYTVTVNDANSCTAVSSSTISEPSSLQITLNSGTSVCVAPTGTATAVTNNSGTPPYTYLWSNGATSKTVTGLPPGYISVIVTDATGACAAIDSIYVGLAGNNTNASFNISGNYCGPGALVNFTHNGSNNTITHFWDFGDGSPSSNFTSPSYTYPTPGTYTVTHIVNRGFCRDTVTTPVTIFQKPILSSVNTNITCNGANNGIIDLTTTGTPAFTYNWGGGITTEDRNNLATGTYTVTVTDPNSCSSTLSATITQPPVLVVTNSNTNVSCNGGANGTINLTVVGGTPSYSYNWGGGITTQNRTGLIGGAYIVTVTDANSCSSVNSISVYQPNPLNLVTNVTNVSCSGQANGTINLTVTGGTGTYSYNWGGGITTQNRTSLGAGTYSVTVTDANSCSSSTSANIIQPSAMVSVLNTTDVSCFGGNNGSIITTNTVGGTVPYTYLWNDGNTDGNRSSLFAGTYSVTITDQNSCTVSGSTAVGQPPTGVNVTIDNTSSVACYGDATGVINITATGGVPGYSFLWSDNSTLEDRTNMLGGTYFVSVTDQQGCGATASATINQPAATVNIDSIVSVDVLCYGAATGSITTAVIGGVLPYSYNWNDGISTPDRSNITAGVYNLTVTDAGSCSVSVSVSITQPVSAVSAAASTTNVSCFGGNNGAINLNVTGGIAPYTFDWGSGITTQNRTGLSSGTYNVVVADSNNCTVSVAPVVTQPATALGASASVTNVTCFGNSNGAISLTITGGTSAYTFNWNDGIATQNRTGIAAGNYAVTVTDANSCSASTSATVTEPVSFSISATAVNATCNGASDGSITLTVSGATPAYNFNWSNGAVTQNLSGITAGNYSVVVRDANNCSANASATVTQPTGMSVSETHSPVSCNGGNNGTITITVIGGVAPYAYSWNDGAVTQNRTNLTAGTYQLLVNDNNSCAVTQPIVITQPTAVTVTLTPSVVQCNGGSSGSVTSVVTGGTPGYSFIWNNGAISSNLNNISAGNYSVTVNDANSCSAVQSATITEPPAFNISLLKTDVACYGANNGSANLTVTGGMPSYNYTWNFGSTNEDISNVSAGNYSVTITDANNCSASRQLTIAQPQMIQVSVAKADPACNNGTDGLIDITVTGGVPPMSYQWNNGSTSEDLQALGSGNYLVNVTDNNGCTSNASATLTAPPAISLTENHRNESCNGSSDAVINLAVYGGTPSYQFVWSNSATTQNIANIPVNTYGVTVTDSKGCAASLNGIVITEPALLGLNISVTDVACAGTHKGSVFANVNGGITPYSYKWSNNSVSNPLTNVAAGGYSLTVTDANSCTQTASAMINTLPQMVVDGTPDVLPCYNATGGIDLTVASGTPPYSFNWSNGATTEDLLDVHPGTYTVVIHDASDCVYDTTFIIVNQDMFAVDATGGGTITLGETVTLYASTSGSSQTTYTWTPAFGMNCSACANVIVQPGQSTIYTVVGIDTNGCEAQDTVSVDVIQDHTFWAPNAFTPNGDGNNDFFQVFGNLAGISKFDVMIFDRWGEKVFDATNSDFKWDGVYKGELLPPNVYVYVIKAVFLDGHSDKIFKGSVTIVR